jgi:hypothetical protein
MKFTAGELYVIGELDLRTGQKTNYYKVGIVREKKERTSAERLKDHQTGNPRELFVYDFIKCQVVEEVETVFHRLMAPKGVRGEWLELDDASLAQAMSIIHRLNEEVNWHYSYFEKAESLKKVVSSESLLPVNDEILGWHKNYATADVRSKAAGRILKSISDALKEAANSGTDLNQFLEIQIKEGRKSLDKDSLLANYPDLYQTYLKAEEVTKQRFNPTIPKEIKESLKEIDPLLFDISESIELAIEDAQAGKRTYQDLHGQYLEVLSIEADADWNKTIAEARLKSACEDAGGIEGIFTWPRSVETKQTFDEKLFREQNPELAEKFTKIGESIKAVIVNPKRGY